MKEKPLETAVDMTLILIRPLILTAESIADPATGIRIVDTEMMITDDRRVKDTDTDLIHALVLAHVPGDSD